MLSVDLAFKLLPPQNHELTVAPGARRVLHRLFLSVQIFTLDGAFRFECGGD